MFPVVSSVLKTRILIDEPGQTCNRFWAYLDSAAWAIMTNRTVHIWFYDESLEYYSNLRKNSHISFPFYIPCLVRLLGSKRWQGFVRRILKDNRFMYRFLSSNYAEKLGFLKSWPMRKSHEFFPMCKHEMRSLFRPDKWICRDVEQLLLPLREANIFIIGVHVRRGDYRQWEGGAYYYELEDYITIMRELLSTYSTKSICFYISTNEKIDSSIFQDLPILNYPDAVKMKLTMAHDLYALSLCDRIIGPLSTFSRWASWYGNVPLSFIERGRYKYDDNDFSVIADFYHFANGREILNLSDK